MKTRLDDRRRTWSLVIPLMLLAASATAQSVGSAEELRAALKKDLAPIGLSIKDEANAVAAELARRLLSELASSIDVTAPRGQLARRGGASDQRDAS